MKTRTLLIILSSLFLVTACGEGSDKGKASSTGVKAVDTKKAPAPTKAVVTKPKTTEPVAEKK